MNILDPLLIAAYLIPGIAFAARTVVETHSRGALEDNEDLRVGAVLVAVVFLWPVVALTFPTLIAVGKVAKFVARRYLR